MRKRRLVVDIVEELRPEAEPMAGRAPPPECRPAKDWSYVWWYDQPFWLTAEQARAVQVLWRDWEEGGRGVHQAAALKAAGSRRTRLGDLFRGHPAWGTMIQPTGKAGHYHLAKPTAGE